MLLMGLKSGILRIGDPYWVNKFKDMQPVSGAYEK